MESKEDVIQIDDQWYVLATSSRADDRTRVLKQGETFGLFDRYGDIQHIGIGEQGLFHDGTRFLSEFELNINGRRPMLLNSTVKEDNSLLVVDLTNPDLYKSAKCIIPKGGIHLFRAKLLWQGVHYEHLRASNFSNEMVKFDLDFIFDADYSDLFEVRGVKRNKRGQHLPLKWKKHELLFQYMGLDNVKRTTRIVFSEEPDKCKERQASFCVELDPHQEKNFYISIACETDNERPLITTYEQALSESNELVSSFQDSVAEIFTSNEQFNDWLNRSASDLNMLITRTQHGAYPYAGVPWFCTPFGRDGIITALQYLWMAPNVARGVLGFLAATQAEEHNPEQDAQPGKILHETRSGEMAMLGEVPFYRYYGSVDATPLFIVLAGAYYQRTGDRTFIEGIWPNIEQAMEWIDTYGDMDGDGFVEYMRESKTGLVQQGWKDSNDSIFHEDGTTARGPIALCEVQGYVYEAKRTMAQLARLFGENKRAEELDLAAEKLMVHFNNSFWIDEINTYAIALDGEKRPCKIVSSNAGHALLSGIASPEYARRVAESLLSNASFSGWGVRTIAAGESNYNPMSYHNGSIWPHDNSMVAMGLAKYGFKDKAMDIMTALFNASLCLDLHRLPELLCGFQKLSGQGPALYTVACAPQAWASGAVFYMLQACLGLTFSPEKPHLRFTHPMLPDYLDSIEVRGMRVGSATIDLAFKRHANHVGITVTNKQGDVEVAVII